MKKYIILSLVACFGLSALAACSNTLHGAGEDIENAGEGVQRAVPPKQ
jgi:predicted small secreted protein